MKCAIFRKSIGLLLLLLAPFFAISQSVTVKGVVKDASGMAIPGVNVLQQGTTNGVNTNIDGAYTIKVPSNSSLTFSFIGYTSQTINVSGKTVIDVTLEEDSKKIDEVVVIGYGTQRKEAVTGSVSTVKNETLQEVPSANITQSLAGRVAGVQMQQTSSKPGAEMQIRIRGTRSLNASNDPLIVLDGIPFSGSLSDISTSDIKSVDILKDASATAIYGSRGANGVIIVTTQGGRRNQNATFTYNGYAGVKDALKYPMMNGEQLSELRQLAGKYINADKSVKYGLDESATTNTDWQDEMYRNAMVQSHDVGVSGGTDKATYSMGLGYYNDESVLPGQDYTRYSLRSTIEMNVSEYFRFGMTTNSNYAITNGSGLGLTNVLSQSPLANPYNEDGSLKRVINTVEDKSWVYTKESIENLDNKWLDENSRMATYNSIFAEVAIPKVEGLKYRVNLGLDYVHTQYNGYTGTSVFSGDEGVESTSTVTNTKKTKWAIENILSYDRTFNEKHHFNVVALYSAEKEHEHSTNISRKAVPETFQSYNLGNSDGVITINPGNQGYYECGLMSYMGRALYSYDNKYMISATVRSDGSSRLASGRKWHTYPAVSVGWNMKDEAFMENVSFLDLLKLRAGYGETSNQSVAAYKTLGRLSTRPYNFGDLFTTGCYISELPNQDLGWEYSKTWNFGVDFGFFNNRLTGTIEYYVQKTNDLLYQLNMPGTSGVSSYMANIGNSENKGIELTLNGTIVNTNGWIWTAGLNIYRNKNKITSLASGQTRDEANWWFVGHPINVVFDYEREGIWQESEADAVKKYEGKDGTVGMIKVKYTGDYDENGYPTRTIGADDRQILDMDPDFEGGFNTTVGYKGFDFTVVGAFKHGGMLISTLYGSSSYLNMMTGRRGNVDIDYWTPENTGSRYPSPAAPKSNDNPKYGTTLGYFDASYLKVRAITLGYSFNQPWVKKMGIDKMRLYATVTNPLIMFSPYHKESGMDPEPNSYGDENQASAAYKKGLLTVGASTPTTRNFMLGLNLTF